MLFFFYELLLLFHFSIIFSLTVLCLILYAKTRDSLIKNFIYIIFPLSVYTFTAFMYYFGNGKRYIAGAELRLGLSLYAVIIVVLSIILFARGVSLYLVNLLSLKRKNRKIAVILINTGSIIFLIFSFFFIFLDSYADWEAALETSINELYIYSSLVIVLPTIVASVYLSRKEGRKNQGLLSQIMIAFYPLLIFVPVDIIFFRYSPFKLINISYMIFSVLVYQFIIRHYIYNYEPEKGIWSTSLTCFIKTTV